MAVKLRSPETYTAMAFTFSALVCVLHGDTDWACVFLLFSMVSLDTAE